MNTKMTGFRKKSLRSSALDNIGSLNLAYEGLNLSDNNGNFLQISQ